MLVKTAFFFSMNSFHLFIVKNSQIHLGEVEDDEGEVEVMLISDFNVDEIKSYP